MHRKRGSYNGGSYCIKTKSILVLSDTHFPYQKKEYFKWIKKLSDKLKPTLVIHIGDLVDFHSISQHLHSAELPNIKYEIEDAKTLKQFRKINAQCLLCGEIIYKNTKTS